MKDIPLLNELRTIRQRLAEDAGLDVERYAAMLRSVGQAAAGQYVTEPLLPPVPSKEDASLKEAG